MSDTVKYIIIGAVVLVLGFFIVNDFVLDEPFFHNQATIENTTPGNQAGPDK